MKMKWQEWISWGIAVIAGILLILKVTGFIGD